MGIVFRQSIKSTLVIFTGVVLGAAFTYFSTIIIPQDDLGGSRLMLAQGAVLQLLLLMGTGSLVQTFSQRYEGDDPRKPVLITIGLLTPIIVAALASIPYYFLKSFIVSRYQIGNRPFIAEFYWWIIALTILLSYITQLEHYLASQYKVAASIFMREVVLRVCLIALLIAFYFGWITFYQYILWMVAVHLVPLLCLLSLASRTKGFFLSRNWNVFSRADYKEILHYSWYHMLTGVSLNVLSFIDVLLLGPLSPSGFSDVATYTNAQFFIAILVVPYRAMASAAFPKLNEVWLQGDKNILDDLFKRAGLNMLIVAVGMWLLVCSNLHNAVAIFPKGYAGILPVVLILSLGRMIDMSTGLNTELISITRYYKFNFRVSLFLLVVVIVADRICIPKWGLLGAAWVASGALVLFNIIKMIFLYLKTGIQPFSMNSTKIFAAGAIVYGVNLLLPVQGSPFLDALVRSILLVTLFAVLMFILRPSPDLLQFARQVRSKKRLF